MTCPAGGKRIGIVAAMFLAAVAGEARAARLPLRSYTTADGLARNTVLHILQDSRGLLWISTTGGLSRFDGYAFASFARDLGLPSDHVNVTFESRSGDLYVGTDRGLCRIRPGADPGAGCSGIPFPDRRRISANTILEDSEGTIWVGAAPGLYRLDPRRESPILTRVAVEFASRPWGADSVESMVTDRKGNLWLGTPSGGVYQRRPDGRTRRFTVREGLPSDTVRALLEDAGGRIWVGTSGGLALLAETTSPGGRVVERVFGEKEGLPRAGVTALLETRDGTLLVGTPRGLARRSASSEGSVSFRLHGKSAGLTDPFVRTLREEREGNVWLGTSSGGLVRLSASGLLAFGAEDGLPEGRIFQIGETRHGTVFILTEDGIGLSRGAYFERVRLPGSRAHRGTSAGTPSSAVEDPGGGWWIGTPQGLRRYGTRLGLADIRRRSPDAVYTAREGLPGRRISTLFVDSRGTLWVGAEGDPQAGLARWERASGRFREFTGRDGLPSSPMIPVAIAEAPAGQVWFAFRQGGVARWRGDAFEYFDAASGLPDGPVTDLHRDRSGRLWAATARGGVGRLDVPSAARPRFTRVTTAQGLASNHTLCLGEDLRGRIYVGHSQGVDRLDPETGLYRHFTSADGLVDSEVPVIFRDRRGMLWLGTGNGLNRLDPVPDRLAPPPTVLITAYEVPGGESRTSLLGWENLGGLVLRPNQNVVTIEYVGVSPSYAEHLSYQTRLEGTSIGWSPPTARRSVTYSQLTPGRYRLQIRVLDHSGIPAPRTASLQFELLKPFWQRGWFISAVGITLLAAITAGYRRRLSRQLELERIRTRIATDLHDDLGATLTQVAFLSEVARRAAPEQRAGGTLERIGALVGQAMDAMDDIVWSVDPTKDRVASLASRLRNFAEEICSGRDIDLRVSLPPSDSEDHLSDPGLRRHVLLFAKECLTNAVRHSGGSIIGVSLALDSGTLMLQIHDNGKGLPVVPGDHGHGLLNLRRRTESLGGRLSVESGPGRGTRVTLTVPLRSKRRWWPRGPSRDPGDGRVGPDGGGIAR